MLTMAIKPSTPPIEPAISARRHQLTLLLCRLAIALSLAVILLGGWTRLNDAGLSCPDWPGCYGQLILPSSEAGQALAQARFENLPLDLSRSWLEMGHRYLAATLGLMIAALALIGWRRRRQASYPLRLSVLLLALVVLQALFGMWTVTLKLLPQVVTLHLLGGVLTLALLLRLQQCLMRLDLRTGGGDSTADRVQRLPCYRIWVGFGLGLLLIQIGLGGWTSSNYAGWACSHWFECERTSPGQAVTSLDYTTAFTLPPISLVTERQGYQGGVLARPARAAIQMVHRLMAVLVSAYLVLLAFLLRRSRVYRKATLLLLSMLAAQLLLGVLNVQLGLPLGLAFAHHLGAVLLLVLLVWLYGLTEQPLRPQSVGRLNGEK